MVDLRATGGLLFGELMAGFVSRLLSEEQRVVLIRRRTPQKLSRVGSTNRSPVSILRVYRELMPCFSLPSGSITATRASTPAMRDLWL